jgi:hypothetical protein
MKVKGVFLLLGIFLIGCSSGGDEIQDGVPSLNAAPSVPVLAYPTNELFCTEFELEFSWQASTDVDGDPVFYTLQIAFDQLFDTIVEEKNVDGTSVMVMLEKGKTLYWRVRANDNHANTSQFGTPWKFYTAAEPAENHLPSVPDLLRPIMSSIVSGSVAGLSWEVVDFDNDILSYDLYLGLTADPPLLVEDLDTNSYDAVIEPDNTYYWKIIANDGQGGVSIGPVWEFRSE